MMMSRVKKIWILVLVVFLFSGQWVFAGDGSIGHGSINDYKCRIERGIQLPQGMTTIHWSTYVSLSDRDYPKWEWSCEENGGSMVDPNIKCTGTIKTKNNTPGSIVKESHPGWMQFVFSLHSGKGSCNWFVDRVHTFCNRMNVPIIN